MVVIAERFTLTKGKNETKMRVFAAWSFIHLKLFELSILIVEN